MEKLGLPQRADININSNAFWFISISPNNRILLNVIISPLHHTKVKQVSNPAQKDQDCYCFTAIVLLESIATSFYFDTLPRMSCSELNKTNSGSVSKEVVTSTSGRQTGLLTLRQGAGNSTGLSAVTHKQLLQHSRDGYDIFGGMHKKTGKVCRQNNGIP